MVKAIRVLMLYHLADVLNQRVAVARYLLRRHGAFFFPPASR
jgi:hypothetical protein